MGRGKQRNEKIDNLIVDNVIKYLKKNIYNKIDLDDVSSTSFYTKTYLNKIFKKIMGKPIIQYYNFLKIEEAKKLLIENKTVVSVANALNFDNANYFSKVFCKFTGTKPSQFTKTIRKN